MEVPGVLTCRPGSVTLPLMIVGPMSTVSGPTCGGTNVKAGGATPGAPDVAVVAGVLAKAAGVLIASRPAAVAAVEGMRVRNLICQPALR
jgi:hypothetical protein